MISWSFGIAVWHALFYLPSSIAFNQIPISNQNDPVSIASWNLNYSSSAPHYFASVYGLLQQWSNTFFPNGHSIVPCEIPPFTKLYHGRMDEDLPPSPEWVAFDIAMSYGIMGSTRNSYMLTYQTTRAAKCIYFDGESATLFGTGQLDTQMLHIYGNTTGPPRGGWGLWDEYGRARGLCSWLQEKKLGGLGWGYEGIVRMNAGFEMIWCNFSSPSIRLISHLNVTAPLLSLVEDESNWANAAYNPTSLFPLPPSSTSSSVSVSSTAMPRPPMSFTDSRREPFLIDQFFKWFLSSTLHYGSSGEGPGLGETRVKLSTCGFLSYYDPIFSSQAIPRAKKEQSSLNLTSDGLWTGPGINGTRKYGLEMLSRRRRLHTLDKISSTDAAIMRLNSEKLLKISLDPYFSNCSGVDWYVLTNGMVQDYADPIFAFLKTLEKFGNLTSTNKTNVKSWMQSVRFQTHTFLLPFLEYPDIATERRHWRRDSELFQNVYSRCRYQHTRLLQPSEGLFLGPEESMLRWAVEETQGSICSILIDISFAVEEIWFSKFNHATIILAPQLLQTLKYEVIRWRQGVEELMAWLGWVGEWTGCEEKCAWDETCYIPMWPVIPWGGGRGPRPPRNGTWPGNGTFTPPPYRYRFPGNSTGPPGRGFNPWRDIEVDLWQPKCTKLDFFITGKRP